MKKESNDREIIMIKVKKLIKDNLEFCNEKSTPYLCRFKETKEGYENIEEFVIKAFFDTNMTISDALSMKENILNPNYITD
jgi:hypothetical protein